MSYIIAGGVVIAVEMILIGGGAIRPNGYWNHAAGDTQTGTGVREINKVLRGLDSLMEFDEGLFGMLVERIKVLNLVQVEFVLRAGIVVVKII